MIAEAIYNSFEEPILAERPVAAEIRSKMIKCGAIRAMMSGSGPSVFGVFEDEKSAAKAERDIVELGFFAKTCRPVSSVL
jgi:4-diphosphocytidyl-2-C-methyl-D-erythritol kinase